MDTVLFIPQVRIGSPSRAETPSPAQTSPAPPKHAIIVTTGNDICGHTIVRYLGIVRGLVVRAPSGTQSLFGGLKQIVGGNIESFAQVCDSARTEAFERMVKHAKQLDADGIIAVRYDATEFAPGVTEVLAYGTAVKLVDF